MPSPQSAVMLERIVTGAPWWVFPLLALLIVLGIRATRPRAAALPRVLIVPAVFIAWGMSGLVPALAASPDLALPAAGAAAGAALLALATGGLDGGWVDVGRAIAHLRGSWIPLLRNVAIFTAKYAIAVAVAMHPADRAQLMVWSVAISGASAGYFVGWLARLTIDSRRAARDA